MKILFTILFAALLVTTCMMAADTVQKGAYNLVIKNVVISNKPSYYLTWVCTPAAFEIVEQTTNLANPVWQTNSILYPMWPTNVVMPNTNPTVFYRVGRCFEDSLYPPIWTTNPPSQ